MAIPVGRRAVRTASSLFTDRVGESDALRASLKNVDFALRQPQFLDEQRKNVLTFYGDGGLGKSALSERLERWIQCEPLHDDRWGPPPYLSALSTARWNLKSVGQSQLDVGMLLVTIRAAITSPRQKWPAFDLALSAYWMATKSHSQPMQAALGENQTDDVLAVLSSIANDLGVLDIVTSLTASAVGKLAKRVIAQVNESRLLRNFEDLPGILNRCNALRLGDSDPDLAADILWLLTTEVECAEPIARPLTVVFIDHFEAAQADNSLPVEQTINKFVASLPWILFVITGRNRVNWDVVRDGLDASGQVFPLLAANAVDEPRQHLLKLLSVQDATMLLTERSRAEQWFVSAERLPELIRKAAKSANGWPLHIDAICVVAANRSADLRRSGERELSFADLRGGLGDLVRRIYEDFSEEQAKVFNAASLLPFFDVELVAAVARTDQGAVERCLNRTMIDGNPGSEYPYRVHDEVRTLIRDAGFRFKGGWSEGDWRDAALRCLDEIGTRHEEAAAAADAAEAAGQVRNDSPVFDALVLGLSVALSENIFSDWISDAFRRSPSIRHLATRLPVPNDEQRRTDAGSYVALAHALQGPGPEAPLKLDLIYQDGLAGSIPAGLWSAYRSRSNGDLELALIRLRELAISSEVTTRQRTIYQNQVSITLRFMRRFDDANEYRRDIGLKDNARFIAIAEGEHGIFTHPLGLFGAYRDAQTSARFRFELDTTMLTRRIRGGNDCEVETVESRERAIRLGEPARHRSAVFTLALHRIADPVGFEACITELQEIGDFGKRIVELRALRALFTGAASDIDRAVMSAERGAPVGFRKSAWIGTEVFLEAIGYPLPKVDTQWLIPYEQVRTNWLATADRIFEVSRNRRVAGQPG